MKKMPGILRDSWHFYIYEAIFMIFTPKLRTYPKFSAHIPELPAHIPRYPAHIPRYPAHIFELPAHIFELPAHIFEISAHIPKFFAHFIENGSLFVNSSQFCVNFCRESVFSRFLHNKTQLYPIVSPCNQQSKPQDLDNFTLTGQ
jgi:hypothetical protein